MIPEFNWKCTLIALVLVCRCQGAFAQDCTQEAKAYINSVVSLTVHKIHKDTGVIVDGNATGFIVSPQGFILTANHLVAKEADIDTVKIEGAIGSLFAGQSPVRFIEDDKPSDVALLQFRDTSHQYIPIGFGDPWAVETGAQMCSLSFSAPKNVDYHVATGTLGSTSGEDPEHNMNVLWTTQLPSNPGESGAPVLYLSSGSGRTGVVGIKYGGDNSAQGLNYIIPINLAGTLLQKYAGVSIQHTAYPLGVGDVHFTIQKVHGDKQVIPVGGWQEFKVVVLDDTGTPVPDAKVAWQTPSGGPLTYVAVTNQAGEATATNLYTAPQPGTYTQTARVVPSDTPTGFEDQSRIRVTGNGVSFTFQQK